MPSTRPALPTAVSLYDARPFFEKALQFGLQHGILPRTKLDAIAADAPKGMVQIARYFGNEFLRPDLEKARQRIVNLVSLYLESSSGGDLQKAAESLRDHSFLSRSKGGSDMLKALLALPTSSHFDLNENPDELAANTPPKGLAEWSLKSFADYQLELASRRALKQEKDAALWLAEALGLESGDLEEAHTHAQAVIRTALLVASCQGTEMPDWASFEALLTALRKKYRPTKSRVVPPADKAPRRKSAGLAIVIPENLPQEFWAVVQAMQQSVAADLPQILDSALPVKALFIMTDDDHHPPLLGRYFWLEDLASELDQHDRAISNAWDKVTGGNCDDGSLLTLFVCVAAGAAPKTLLTEKAATVLIRKIQKAGAPKGFDPEAAHQYILDHAPAQHQADYAHLWSAFVDEALPILQSDSAYAQQDALALLRRECNVMALKARQ